MPDLADALVLFGATGDLAHKKIFASLHSMAKRGHLTFPVIGVAASGWDLAKLKERARDGIDKFGGGVDEAAFAVLCEKLRYVDGDYRAQSTFDALHNELGGAKLPAFYLAIPPSLFPAVIQALECAECDRGARVIIEKPFGHDLESAVALNTLLADHFPERQIFRIDHYLGKEPVMNLAFMRFANTFFEPVWNHHYIEQVQITMAESFGVEGRGKFFEETGALRDVFQNHLLQVMAYLCMEPPGSGSGDGLRGETAKLMRAIVPINSANAVYGQYTGYRDEAGVAKESQTETYVAVKVEIDSTRWGGVPFYVRAGKELPITATEIYVKFRQPVQKRFGMLELKNLNNYVRFRLNPEISTALGVTSKTPGSFDGQSVELMLSRLPGAEMDAYELLLWSAINGDVTHFARQDGVEAAWKVVDGLMQDPPRTFPYERGSWGPDEANAIFETGHYWHDIRANPM